MSNLSSEQFGTVSHGELAKMYSGDFDVPMSGALTEMHRDDLSHLHGDPDGRHPAYKTRSDTPRTHVNHLAKDIAKNGMREPITVRGGNVITDGHHRALAAMKLRMNDIPVRHIQ